MILLAFWYNYIEADLFSFNEQRHRDVAGDFECLEIASKDFPVSTRKAYKNKVTNFLKKVGLFKMPLKIFPYLQEYPVKGCRG